MATQTPVPPVPPPYTVATLPLTKIHVLDAIQPRADLTDSVVDEYATLYAEAEDSEPLPPLDVFAIKRRYYVTDGFHRLAAARKAKRTALVCHVYTGTQPEAMRHAAFANLRRGLAYSQHDRQRILERLLQAPETRQRSNRDLGQMFGMSHVTVGRARHRLEITATLEAEWQALPVTQAADDARRLEQTATFLEAEPPLVASYEKLLREPYDRAIPSVARYMTDQNLSEAEAKAQIRTHMQREVQLRESVRQSRRRQQAQREARLFEELRQVVEAFDDAAPLTPVYFRHPYTRAEMVQALAPARREELRVLLEQAAATVQALTALLDASSPSGENK